MAGGNRITPRDDQSGVSEETPAHRRPRALLLSAGVTALLVAMTAACDGDATADPVTTPAGSAQGAVGPSADNGEALARSKGCAGCHGQDFTGGAGPAWVGLAGSEVLLVDGTTVVADDDYLTRAITDPSADLSEGFNLKMPANGLTDAEVADLVAFINTLGDE